MSSLKAPEGLTVRISTNVRDNTTKIVAYRKGRFKYAYKATLPMCSNNFCKLVGPHKTRHLHVTRHTSYHQSDVETLVNKLIKSYA